MRRPPRFPSRRRGFTLLELLVAITVLSVVSLIAWRGLDSLVHTRERLQPEAEDVRALLVAFGQIERDLSQIVNSAFLPLPMSPLTVHGDGQPGFDLVRFAPAAATESSAIQVVSYELRDGQLLRRASAPLDAIGTEPPPAAATSLLADVLSLRVRVWQAGRGWAPAATVPPGLRPPPGIEVEIERADGRPYRRVLLVG